MLGIGNGRNGDPCSPELVRVISADEQEIRRISDEQTAQILHEMGIRNQKDYDRVRSDLNWLHACRSILSRLGRRALWLVISSLLLGMMALCSHSMLYEIRHQLEDYHETGQNYSR